MKGDVIPENDTVARYCPFGRLSEDGKPKSAAFQFTGNDLADECPHLSVNWLEYFKTRDEQISEVRAILAKKLNKVGGNAKLALVKVSEVHEKAREAGLEVRVLHWPDVQLHYNDESHSGIFDVELDADVIALKLSQMNCTMVAAKTS